jgi:hypothetical protein
MADIFVVENIELVSLRWWQSSGNLNELGLRVPEDITKISLVGCNYFKS